MSFHPLAERLPELSPAEYAALKLSMQQPAGQIDPTVLLDGMILDGRHRARVVAELGIPLKTIHFDPAWGDPVEVVIAKAQGRNMTIGQRVCLAESFMDDLLKVERRGRPKKSAESPPITGKSSEAAALRFGVSARQVEEARTLRRRAPRLYRQVSSGELTVSQAMARHRQGHRRRELTARSAPTGHEPKSLQIITGDCVAEMALLPRRSFRLVFADPPYNEGVDYGSGKAADRLPPDQFMAWCERWMREAAELLTPDGSMWTLISERYVARFDVMRHAVGLHRRDWVIWNNTFGPHRRDNFGRCATHLLYFVKDPARFVFDAEAPDALAPGDRGHKYDDARKARPDGLKLAGNVWSDIPRVAGTFKARVGTPTQLPVQLLRRVVACATEPGDQVLDPFSGSATTGAACVELGRRYVGIESNAKTADLSRQRLRGLAGRLIHELAEQRAAAAMEELGPCLLRPGGPARTATGSPDQSELLARPARAQGIAPPPDDAETKRRCGILAGRAERFDRMRRVCPVCGRPQATHNLRQHPWRFHREAVRHMHAAAFAPKLASPH